jgi:trehalose 6-phosphate synthase
MDADRLLIASNRGPVMWRDTDDGLVAQRGFGGLVTALGGALQDEPGTWVSVAISEADRRVAAAHPDGPFDAEAGGHRYNLRLVDAGERFDAYYNEISNRLLWFTVHGLWNPPYHPSTPWLAHWHDGYAAVNDAVARAVVEAAGERPEIHLHDYHLTAVGPAVRSRLPDVPLLHYIHTPWPRPRDLGHMPDTVAHGVLEGLLAADLVAFSAPQWASAFRRCAVEVAGADLDGETVVHGGRRTLVTDFVLGVDEIDLQASASAPRTRDAGEDLDRRVGDRQLILRVDRTDLSKNVLRGLLAYELLLERHPEHRGRVWHYAHLNPSRQGVEEYREYLDACRATAERVRGRFGADALEMFVGDDYPGAVAALQRYDVLLANPVRDGTNLVAKEGPALNRKDGVVVLSREAGAATVMADSALVVNPFDVEEQAEALHAALTMPADERAARAARGRGAAKVGAPEAWFAEQRAALRRAVADRR